MPGWNPNHPSQLWAHSSQALRLTPAAPQSCQYISSGRKRKKKKCLVAQPCPSYPPPPPPHTDTQTHTPTHPHIHYFKQSRLCTEMRTYEKTLYWLYTLSWIFIRACWTSVFPWHLRPQPLSSTHPHAPIDLFRDCPSRLNKMVLWCKLKATSLIGESHTDKHLKVPQGINQ